jgi:hypothetical protein
MPEEESKNPLDVYEVLSFMADQLAAIAWTKLGLQPDLGSGKIEKDLPQAKATIDTIAYIAKTMKTIATK